MRKRLLFFSLALLSALLCAGSALALDVSIVDNGGNNVTIDSVSSGSGGNWYVGITEEYQSVNSVWTGYTQQAGASYAGNVYIEKAVTNNSGLLWRDFHMKLWVIDNAGKWVPSPNNDGLYFQGITSSGPFSQTWYDPNAVDELWLWDGTWNVGETYTLAFSVGGWGWSGNSVPQFRLEQWPTDTGGPSIPEPATMLLLGLGLVGLAGARKLQK